MMMTVRLCWMLSGPLPLLLCTTMSDCACIWSGGDTAVFLWYTLGRAANNCTTCFSGLKHESGTTSSILEEETKNPWI